MRDNSQNTKIIKIVDKDARFDYVDQESRDSMRDAVMPIWAETEFIPAHVRLIKRDIELLLGMGVIWELLLIADCNRRYAQVGQGGWHVMVRDSKNLWVFVHVPTARGHTKLEAYLLKMRNR